MDSPKIIDNYGSNLVDIGYELLENEEIFVACDKWFEAWQHIKNTMPKKINKIEDTIT